tara:strand:+ start:2689 stop:3438 length:750 start_codon:yes stop_codon:yes gene_type:complete
MNNSKDGQRVRIVHGKTKNYIDMDVKKNTQIKAHQDFIVRSDRNTVFEVGKNPDSDMMSLTVRGDLRIYVEGDTHYECEGNFNHRVNGDYKLTVGGNYLNETKSNYSLKTANTTKIKTAKYINEGTTYHSHYKVAEQKTDKFHAIKQTSNTGAVSVHSEGNLALNTEGTRYEVTKGNQYNTMFGKVRDTVYGNDKTPIAGGNFIGAVDAPQSSSYYRTVTGDVRTDTTGNMDINADGNIDMDAANIYLN